MQELDSSRHPRPRPRLLYETVLQVIVPGGSTCEDPASPPPRLNEHMVWLRGKHKQAVDDMFAEMCQCCEELKAIQHAHLEQEGWLMERFLEHEKTQRKQDRQLLERLVSVILSRPQPACPCQHPGME